MVLPSVFSKGWKRFKKKRTCCVSITTKIALNLNIAIKNFVKPFKYGKVAENCSLWTFMLWKSIMSPQQVTQATLDRCGDGTLDQCWTRIWERSSTSGRGGGLNGGCEWGANINCGRPTTRQDNKETGRMTFNWSTRFLPSCLLMVTTLPSAAPSLLACLMLMSVTSGKSHSGCSSCAQRALPRQEKKQNKKKTNCSSQEERGRATRWATERPIEPPTSSESLNVSWHHWTPLSAATRMTSGPRDASRTWKVSV